MSTQTALSAVLDAANAGHNLAHTLTSADEDTIRAAVTDGLVTIRSADLGGAPVHVDWALNTSENQQRDDLTVHITDAGRNVRDKS